MCKKRQYLTVPQNRKLFSWMWVCELMGSLLLIWSMGCGDKVLHASKKTESPTDQAAGNCSRKHVSKPRRKGNLDVDRLISYIHHFSDYKQYCHVGMHNNADWDGTVSRLCAGDLEDSKSTSGWIVCLYGSHAFVPISWMCPKQTLSHTAQQTLK